MESISITYETLTAFAADYTLAAYCPCGHGGDVDLDAMIKMLGPDYSTPHVAMLRRLRCDQCGMAGLGKNPEGLPITLRVSPLGRPGY